MTQREKDQEHFAKQWGLNPNDPQCRRAADGAEHGRRDLARRVLDALNNCEGWDNGWKAAEAVCQPIIQDQAPAPSYKTARQMQPGDITGHWPPCEESCDVCDRPLLASELPDTKEKVARDALRDLVDGKRHDTAVVRYLVLDAFDRR